MFYSTTNKRPLIAFFISFLSVVTYSQDTLNEKVITNRIYEIKQEIQKIKDFDKRVELIKTLVPLIKNEFKKVVSKKFIKYRRYRESVFHYQALLEKIVERHKTMNSEKLCDSIRGSFIFYFSPKNSYPARKDFLPEVYDMYELWSIACNRPDYMDLSVPDDL